MSTVFPTTLKHSFTTGTRNIFIYLWFPLRNQNFQNHLKKSKRSKFILMKYTQYLRNFMNARGKSHQSLPKCVINLNLKYNCFPLNNGEKILSWNHGGIYMYIENHAKVALRRVRSLGGEKLGGDEIYIFGGSSIYKFQAEIYKS